MTGQAEGHKEQRENYRARAITAQSTYRAAAIAG